MTAAARNQLLESISKEYKDASLSRKSELLDGFVTGTGYHRKYATNLLNKGLPTSSGLESGRQSTMQAFFRPSVCLAVSKLHLR